MSVKLLFSAIFIVVIASVYVIRQTGYNPKPILTMKASKYESTEIVGNGLFRRFFKEAQMLDNFYVFCEPEQCSKIKIWESFLKQSELNKLKARSIYLSEGLKIKHSQNKVNEERTISFYPISMRGKVKIDHKKSIIFYMANFYVNKDEEKIKPICKKEDQFTNLDCLASEYSKKYYKKKFNKKDTHVGMEQISHNKFIIYLN